MEKWVKTITLLVIVFLLLLTTFFLYQNQQQNIKIRNLNAKLGDTNAEINRLVELQQPKRNETNWLSYRIIDLQTQIENLKDKRQILIIQPEWHQTIKEYPKPTIEQSNLTFRPKKINLTANTLKYYKPKPINSSENTLRYFKPKKIYFTLRKQTITETPKYVIRHRNL